MHDHDVAFRGRVHLALGKGFLVLVVVVDEFLRAEAVLVVDSVVLGVDSPDKNGSPVNQLLDDVIGVSAPSTGDYALAHEFLSFLAGEVECLLHLGVGEQVVEGEDGREGVGLLPVFDSALAH